MDGIHHITPYWRSGPEEKLSNEQLPTYVPSLAVRHHNDSCGLSSRGPVENVWSRFRKSFCFFSPMEHLGGFSLPEKKARFFHVTPINSDVSPQPTWLFVSVACPAFFEIWDGGLLQVVLRVFGYHLLDGDLGPGEHRNIGKPNGEMWWEIWSDVLSFSFVMICFWGEMGWRFLRFWDTMNPWKMATNLFDFRSKFLRKCLGCSLCTRVGRAQMWRACFRTHKNREEVSLRKEFRDVFSFCFIFWLCRSHEHQLRMDDSMIYKRTADGRNPTPPGMYKTLYIK